MKREWAGDVDLNDGQVATEYDIYVSLISRLKQLGVTPRRRTAMIKDDCNFISAKVKSYRERLQTSMHL